MTAIDSIRGDLAAGKTVLLDGATGTELERRGADMHDAAWCAMATLTAPGILGEVHEDYIRAGARIITTNTFSTNRNMLDPGGLGDRFEEVNRRAVEIALAARDRHQARERVLVAGSMSHQVPTAGDADGRNRRALPRAEVAAERFQEMASLLERCGVDLLLMEMMSDPELANPAIAAARATGLPVWVGFSVRRNDAGDLVSFSRDDLDVAQMLADIDLDGVEVAGIMHSNVSLVEPALKALRRRFSGALMVYPDSGYFVMPHWHFEDIIAADDFARCCQGWIDQGAQVVGGCCGLGLEHIKALARVMG